MNEREQGKVLLEIKQSLGISNEELARRTGKSRKWIDSRIKVAMKLHDSVARAFDDNKISFTTAEAIASIDMPLQEAFLSYILTENIRDESEVRKAKKHFLNNTIYTIGYEGRDLKTFIQTLKDNGIEQVIDIRYSNECSDPHFSGEFFAEQLS